MTAAEILIVDDDDDLCDASAGYLQAAGLRLRTAQDAMAMDRALAASPAEVLLVDLMMPAEDGLPTCRRLGGRGPAMLMLSGQGGRRARQAL